ncbi:efflux RND transporter periplasmic adaptor subunit [Roseateles oligotrophus]|uniref:Efflux RND transporter periplasmic adaptor subunit n=1 Tax=Roseateles oligotrophus TaxID=1769250 RepID=A0ABT2YL96_9BURK|nr:efflux RND transporter periplasmic adaptor subunit [Roseateles oligotrophus]MCV2370837.1 efflux RND transporter periplasmic adaptor subunit [Roseateles oligotrophus]
MTVKKFHTLVAVVALVGLSGAAYWWQHRPAQAAGLESKSAGKMAGDGGGKSAAGPNAPSGPTPVEVGNVESVLLPDDAQTVGTLKARQSALLKPEVSGRIVKLGFTDGQNVRQGQLLVQLDDSLQAAQLQQSQAQASIARSSLKRNNELLAQGFVSPSAVDQSQSVLQVAEAQVALSQAQLARMQVRAPFDGVMGIRMVNVGDYVKDGSDLVSIEDTSMMWLDFRLPERFVPRLKIGQQLEVQLDALPGRAFTAQIAALDTQLDANGRSLLVRAKLPAGTPELRSGLFARVRVLLAVHQNALLVPEEALVPQGGKQYIIKLQEDGAGPATAQRFEAKLGLRLPGKVEILSGLKAGDRVVTAGQAKLMRGEGQVLKIIDVDKQGISREAVNAMNAASAASAASH